MDFDNQTKTKLEPKISHDLKTPKEQIGTSLTATGFQPILWNIPNQPHLFMGREALLEELHQQLSIPSKTITQAHSKQNAGAIVAFAGLGGIGKTQLALHYIYHTKHPYTLKAWFPANNIHELKQMLTDFAKSLGFVGQKNSFDAGLIYLKQWLTQHPGWLLVYDNVNNYEEIKPYLIESGGSIILTSRHQTWPAGLKKLEIGVMPAEDCIKHIQTICKRDKELLETKELAKTLGYLPLAVAEACAYIVQKNISIAHYLKLYNANPIKLLSDNSLSNDVSRSVATTWNITLELIPKEARELFTVCAYLAPDKISKNLLLTWFKQAYANIKEPELVVLEYLNQLRQYSFIEYDGDKYIRVHCLVQAVIRHQHHSELNKTTEKFYNKLYRIKQTFSTQKYQSVEHKNMQKWYNIVLYAADTAFWQNLPAAENIAHKNELMPHLYALVEHFEATWGDSPSFEFANILHAIGYVLLAHIADYNKAKHYFEKCLIIARNVASTNFPFIAVASKNLGLVYGKLGNTQKEVELLEQALTLNEQHFERDYAERADTLGKLGGAYGKLGNTQKEIALLEEALTLGERHFGKEHVQLANIIHNLGVAYGTLGNTQKQKKLLEQALIIKERYFSKEHLEVSYSLHNLGIYYGKLGNYQKEKNLLEQTLAIKERHFGKEHVEVAHILHSLGIVYGKLGNKQKEKELIAQALTPQEEYLKQTLTIKEGLFSKEPVELVTTLYNLGITYAQFGNFKKEIEVFEQALTILERNFGKDHVQVAVALTELGNAYGNSGNTQKQKALLEEALSIHKRHLDKGNVDMATTLHSLGQTYGKLGNNQKAVEYLEQALTVQERHFGKDHIEIAYTLNHLGEAYDKLRNTQKEIESYEQALIIHERYFDKENLPLDMGIVLWNLTLAYQKLNKIEKAHHTAKRCLAVYKKVLGEQHSETENAKALLLKCEKMCLDTKAGLEEKPSKFKL